MTTNQELTPSQRQRVQDEWTHAVQLFAIYLDDLGTLTTESAAGYCRKVLTVSREQVTGPFTITGSELAASLNSRTWSKATRKSTLVALRRFYAWAIVTGHLERSPMTGIPDGLPIRPGPLAVEPTRAWAEIIEAYLITLQAAGRRRETIGTRRAHLTRLSHEFSDPWTLTSDDLARFLSRDDWSPEYRRSFRTSIRQLFKWAVLTERIDRDPTVPLAPIRVPRALPRPAPDSAILAALAVADNRTRLAIELGMYAGLRISEVASLPDAAVLSDRICVTGKGGNQRFVPLHPELRTSIAAERARRAAAGIDSPWLFPSSAGGHLTRARLGKLVSTALPDGWTHHTLRHRFATQAYGATRDLRAVQELLGHTKPETTARYAAVPNTALNNAVAAVGINALNPIENRAL